MKSEAREETLKCICDGSRKIEKEQQINQLKRERLIRVKLTMRMKSIYTEILMLQHLIQDEEYDDEDVAS
ncbi:CBM_collapsed_G0024450.mRNA.1.CDS.1 [Saccharomyces cerevisiae]|nr:CBM_collapsed_G0024450.mRNA.1.CDS.1 [Saccharomyces cerevisiae]